MKKILIIGATSAIAEHCARIWATTSDALYLVARNKEHVQIIASDLKVRGAAQVTTYCTDLNDMDRHSNIIESAENAMNGIDIVLIAHGTLSNQKSCEGNISETLSEIQTSAVSTVSLLTLLSNRYDEKKDCYACAVFT